jgi:predicted amidohydrolase
MKIAVSQWNTTEGKVKQNLKKARYFISRAIGENVDIIAFPELFITGYDMSYIKSANHKEIHNLFLSLQKDNIAIAGTIPYNHKGKILNRMFFLSQNVNAYYDKIHLFRKNGEDNVFFKGNNLEVFKYKEYKIAMLICYDIRFPYLFSQLFTEKIDLLIVSAQWPLSRLNQWTLLLRSRALELQCYIMASNRCGSSKDIEFAGHSLIASPQGKIITRITNYDGFTLWDIDKSNIETFRNEIPVYEDKTNVIL